MSVIDFSGSEKSRGEVRLFNDRASKPVRWLGRPVVRALLFAALLAATAAPSAAELVVFTHGYVLRVESFQVDGDEARVVLPSGGIVRFPLTKVGRVVAHEVDLTPEEWLLPAMDLGLDTKDGPDAAPDAPKGELSLESSPPEELDPAEPDPARSISGKVLNEAGEPVDGVEVRARAIRLFEAEGGSSHGQPEVQTRSDLYGLYRFEQLAEGEYGIRSLATDRYTSARKVVRTGAGTADLVLNEKRDFAIYGSVINIEGEPLPEARVTFLGRSPIAASTDHGGYYRLEIPIAQRGGTYTLSFEREGYGERTLELADSQILGRSEVRLDALLERLELLVVVEGKVSNPAGAPVSGETVFLVGEQQYQTVTDQAGQFLIHGVDAHTKYQLWITPRGPYQKVTKQVQVGAERVRVDVVLEAERSEYASLSGRMIDASGNPLPHFSLWLRSTDSSARQPLLVTGDGAGRFSAHEVPVGPVSFSTVSEPRLVINGLGLAPGGVENVELILDSGSFEVRGRVLDSYGNPVAAPQVTLEWSHRGGGLHSLSLRRSTADAAGFFSFTDVGPGVHFLSVVAPGFESAQLRADSPGDLVVELQTNAREGASGGK